MTLRLMFNEIKAELQKYIIDNPKVCNLELRVVFGWTLSQELVMMKQLRNCAGIDGNEFFLFETKHYWCKDFPGKRYNLCSEAGYARKHNLPKSEKPHRMDDKERLAHRRVVVAKRAVTVEAEDEAKLEAALSLNELWPSGEQARIAESLL